MSDSPSQTIINLLENLLSSNNNKRNNAENELKNLKLSNITFLINDLLIILKEPNSSLNIKKLCAIIIKNTLIDLPANWLSLSYTEQLKIRMILTEIIFLQTDVETMKQSALILSSIAYIELTQQKQSQIKQLIEGIINPNNSSMVISVYLYSIKIFFEQYKNIQSIDASIIQPILFQVISNLASSNTIDIIVLTLELIVLLLPFSKNYIISKKDNIVLPIINITHKYDNVQIIVNALLAINEVIRLYHKDIVCYSEEILKTVINLISNSKINEITLYSINILCSICDKESFVKTKMSECILDISKNLATLIIQVIELNTTLVIEEEWCISKAASYFLSYLVQIQLNSSLVEMLFIYVSNNYYNVSTTKRYIALIILSCCLESNHKELLSSLLLSNMTNIWSKINESNPVISIALSWVLGKLTELLPNVFERKAFHELIPTLINTISSEKINLVTRINTAVTFGNIIRFYGDENTSYNKNYFTPYYKIFVDKFIDLACNLNPNSSALAFYLFRIVMNVVQYSSLEFQDQLEILLTKLISNFEIISNALIQESINSSYYKELQINICLIIHQILSKIIRRVDKNLCKRLYNAIMESFFRNGPYESGILCLFNIVIIIENDINMNQFFNYIFHCFDVKDNYLLIQGAVATISNLAWNKNNTMNQKASQIMLLLFSLLTDEDINYSVKPVAISAIGDICYNYPSDIIEHIQSIITLLFSTFEVVISTKDDDCMLILKNSIECFSMLLLSVQETHKEEMIFMFIKQLIGYIIYFSSIDRNDIKTNLIMLFGDLINLVGQRIREFTTEEEIKMIQSKLQVNASDNSLKWMNTIINKNF